jgi:hypothetical protein
LVYFNLSGTSICAKVNPDVDVRPGVPIRLSAKLANMHLINDENGMVL